jgi:four helix bundle protein
MRRFQFLPQNKKANNPEDPAEKINSHRDLEVYKLAFSAAMEIFQLTKKFPPEERYSLTDQIRRASRSVCSNLAEAWRKRGYIAVFRNKLTDAQQEGSETQTWLDFCLACEYINQQTFERLDQEYEKILGMLNSMEMKADKFCF